VTRKHQYQTAPVSSSRVPGGIPYIIGNEFAERFSFYGMRAVLTIFMTKYLLDRAGEAAPMSHEDAKGYFHLFTTVVYFTPVLGALVSDVVLGKYRTIILLSIVYCLGHLALAIDETRTGLAVGLVLIAIGAGGIKPCVSAHVGDQFGKTNQHLLTRVFQWFYFSINVGSFASTLLTPLLLHYWGPHWAFGVPGALMLLATIVFWMGRNKFVHIPPRGTTFFRDSLTPENRRAIGQLLLLFFFVAPFWALFDQTGSSWVLQAEHMDRSFLGWELLPSQIQAANPILVLLFIPFCATILYPALGKLFRVTPLRIIGIGLLLTCVAATIPAFIEMRIEKGDSPSIGWQLVGYVILTLAEVMVSITCLEFSYTQAPRSMKSLIMSIWFLSVATGNAFTSAVNFLIGSGGEAHALQGANYFWFFAAVNLVFALLFLVFARFYKEKTYIQKEQQEEG
jgi:POT family proton-dependent oligopeptide transporter